MEISPRRPRAATSDRSFALRCWGWLDSIGRAAPDGRMPSWVNPAHPGYPYDEATGSALSLALWAEHTRPGWLPGAEDLGRRMQVALLGARRDWAGRNGSAYLFDTALCAAALSRAPSAEARALGARMGDRAALMLRLGKAVEPPPVGPPRWSTLMGPHVVKACAFLLQAGSIGVDEARVSSAAVVERWRGGDDDAIARSPAETTYAHAMCYYAEGLAMLAHLGLASLAPLARAVADRIAAALDSANAGMPEWVGGQGAGHGPIRSDATAQAIRLMVWSDPERHRARIEGALRTLDALSPGGGVRYGPDSADENTTSTIFALQAAAWAASGGADPGAWI